ncbi:MAG: hypothetical protein WD032_04035 [Nitrospirales bacterium]
MRNLVLAYKVARQKNKQPAVVIVYADHPDLSMAQMVESQAWTTFTKTVRQDQVSLHVWSYQDILALAQDATRQCGGEPTVWKELDARVNKKISAIKKSSKKPKARKFTHSGMVLVSENGVGEKGLMA